MCIKAIANFDFEAAKDHVKETIKYLDAGKLLGVAGLALEADPKALVNKVIPIVVLIFFSYLCKEIHSLDAVAPRGRVGM